MTNKSEALDRVRPSGAVRICLFSHSSQLGGAERMLLELVGDLICNYSVVCAVVLPSDGPLVVALKAAGAQCIIVEYRWWCVAEQLLPVEHQQRKLMWESIKSIFCSALGQIRKFDPDVIWTQTLVIPWGAMVASELGKPHIWYVTEFGELDHGLKFFSPFQNVIEEVIESSDHIFVCSQIVADTIFPSTLKDRTEVLYFHIPTPAETIDRESRTFFDISGAFKVGIFSTITPAKGTEDIVRAVAQLCAQGRNIELLVAGYGAADYRAYLKEVVRSYGAENRVKFFGFLDDPYPAMREIDVAVVCSRSEALGRVGVEAMLLGKPVIYPNTGGVKEYMIEGKTGLSYSPGDIAGLAGRLNELINEPSRRIEMGALGRVQALEKFSSRNYGGRVFQTLQMLRRSERNARSMPRSLQIYIGAAVAAALDSTAREQQGDEIAKAHACISAELKCVSEELQQMRRDRDDLVREIADIRSTLDAEQRARSDREAQLVESRNSLEHEQQARANIAARLSELQAEFEAFQKFHFQAKDALVAAQRDIECEKLARGTAEDEQRRLKSKLLAERERADILTQELRDMIASYSWRVTAPIRKISLLLKRTQ